MHCTLQGTDQKIQQPDRETYANNSHDSQSCFALDAWGHPGFGADEGKLVCTAGDRCEGPPLAQMGTSIDADSGHIMIESEGITENVRTWRTDVVARIVNALGLERVMFEAADPEVFAWYIKNYGPEVNLFVDHSQIVQLECLRSGIWGTKSLWGRVVTFKG